MLSALHDLCLRMTPTQEYTAMMLPEYLCVTSCAGYDTRNSCIVLICGVFATQEGTSIWKGRSSVSIVQV